MSGIESGSAVYGVKICSGAGSAFARDCALGSISSASAVYSSPSAVSSPALMKSRVLST